MTNLQFDRASARRETNEILCHESPNEQAERVNAILSPEQKDAPNASNRAWKRAMKHKRAAKKRKR